MGDFAGEGTSHGICPKCFEKVKAELAARKAAASQSTSPEIKEGRCEDYPCCGHEPGGCPSINPETGEETYPCATCGAPLPPHSRSSLCGGCLDRMHRNIDMGYDEWN